MKSSAPIPGWNPRMATRRSWPRTDKLRLAACLASSALIYGAVSAALFFGSKSFVHVYAGPLVIIAVAMLPVMGLVTGCVTRPTKPWSEAWVIGVFVTVVVLATVLGMEASQNTCGTPGSGSCDTAAGASFVFLGPPVFVVVSLGVFAGKSFGRWAARRKISY
jgi:chromate transport protein ChrA